MGRGIYWSKWQTYKGKGLLSSRHELVDFQLVRRLLLRSGSLEKEGEKGGKPRWLFEIWLVGGHLSELSREVPGLLSSVVEKGHG